MKRLFEYKKSLMSFFVLTEIFNRFFERLSNMVKHTFHFSHYLAFYKHLLDSGGQYRTTSNDSSCPMSGTIGLRMPSTPFFDKGFWMKEAKPSKAQREAGAWPESEGCRGYKSKHLRVCQA